MQNVRFEPQAELPFYAGNGFSEVDSLDGHRLAQAGAYVSLLSLEPASGERITVRSFLYGRLEQDVCRGAPAVLLDAVDTSATHVDQITCVTSIIQRILRCRERQRVLLSCVDGMLYELVDGNTIHVLQTRVEEVRDGMRVIFTPDKDYWLRAVKP